MAFEDISGLDLSKYATGVGKSSGLIPGQIIRTTCLYDHGDGTYSLTLQVGVRPEDLAEAAELLARGRALQAKASAVPCEAGPSRA